MRVALGEIFMSTQTLSTARDSRPEVFELGHCIAAPCRSMATVLTRPQHSSDSAQGRGTRPMSRNFREVDAVDDGDDLLSASSPTFRIGCRTV
jgi:hypothetical protein